MVFNVTSFCNLTLLTFECLFLCAKYPYWSWNIVMNQTDKFLPSSCVCVYIWKQTLKKVKLVKYVREMLSSKEKKGQQERR